MRSTFTKSFLPATALAALACPAASLAAVVADGAGQTAFARVGVGESAVEDRAAVTGVPLTPFLRAQAGGTSFQAVSQAIEFCEGPTAVGASANRLELHVDFAGESGGNPSSPLASSTFDFDFTLDAAQTFQAAAQDDISGYVLQDLDGAAVFDLSDTGQASGTLAPGSYKLFASYVSGPGDGDSAASVSFRIASVGNLPGDANGDGAVTIADFAILRANFGTAADGDCDTTRLGDFNGDRAVTIADFAILRANFGTSVTATDLAEADAWAASVPEPAGLTLAATAALALRRRRGAA